MCFWRQLCVFRKAPEQKNTVVLLDKDLPPIVSHLPLQRVALTGSRAPATARADGFSAGGVQGVAEACFAAPCDGKSASR